MPPAATIQTVHKANRFFTMMQFSKLSDAALMKALAENGIRLHAREGRLGVNAPTGVVDDALRKELGRRKESLLQLLQARQAQPGETIPRRKTQDPAEQIPQTPAQQGMWLQDHFSKGEIAYNIAQAFLMHVSLDLLRLQNSVDALLMRHEVLRTSFYQDEGKLFQRVSTEARSIVGFTDLSVLSVTERERSVAELLQQHSRTAFDLGVAPLIRFHVFRLGESGDVLFFNIHHIIADRGSILILREDLLGLYSAATDTERLPIADNSVQFADYALWAAEQLKSPAIQMQEQYWKQKLAGVAPYLSLPHSRPLPERRTSNGATLPVQVDAMTVNALTSLGQEFGATPFMVFLSAFAVLLSQLSGEDDFCVGTPMTHRRHVELERTIGLFVNMVALRCRPQPQMHFVDLLDQIRTTTLEAFENSDVPFQWLLRMLRPDRRIGRSPIFQVLFIFESFVPRQGEGEQAGIEAGTARYDLTLQLTELENGALAGVFEYCTDIFTDKDIHAFSEALYDLLPQLASSPRQPLAELLLPVRAQFTEASYPATKLREAPPFNLDPVPEKLIAKASKAGFWRWPFGAG